jgi:hypothetical protein
MNQPRIQLPPGTLFAWHEGGQALLCLHLDGDGNPTGQATAYPVRTLNQMGFADTALAYSLGLPWLDQPRPTLAMLPPMGARHFDA